MPSRGERRGRAGGAEAGAAPVRPVAAARVREEEEEAGARRRRRPRGGGRGPPRLEDAPSGRAATPPARRALYHPALRARPPGAEPGPKEPPPVAPTLAPQYALLPPRARLPHAGQQAEEPAPSGAPFPQASPSLLGARPASSRARPPRAKARGRRGPAPSPDASTRSRARPRTTRVTKGGQGSGCFGEKECPALSEYGGRELRSLALAFGREQGKWGLAPENVQAKLFNFVGNAGKQTPGVRLTRRERPAGALTKGCRDTQPLPLAEKPTQDNHCPALQGLSTPAHRWSPGPEPSLSQVQPAGRAPTAGTAARAGPAARAPPLTGQAVASTPATAAKRTPPHFRFRSAAPFGDPEGTRRKQRWLSASPLSGVGHSELPPDFGVDNRSPVSEAFGAPGRRP
ncbi:atherin-like [Bos indicus]|uniref:Atherin-like n=1 Tax=Bos indicus TaxID=9915 RepID=A0ABM4SKR9_BOSIN